MNLYSWLLFAAWSNAEEENVALQLRAVAGDTIMNPTSGQDAFVCDDSVNFIVGDYVQIALTDACPNCSANPIYGESMGETYDSNLDADVVAKALEYCKAECMKRSDCTAFFFQKHGNGHEICGFYSDTVKLASAVRHGHQACSQVCIRGRPEPDSCVQWNMVTHQIPGFPGPGPDYTVYKTYEIPEGGFFKDAAWLYRTNLGHCTMLFRASDSGVEDARKGIPSGDIGNTLNFKPIDKWGLSGVHAGVATELEGLLELMDFQEIRDACPGSFSVAGASLGGALAALFAILLTQEGDILKARLKLHELNTFASFAVTTSPASNNQSSDGCFAGSQYWYAQALPDGRFVVDTVADPRVGAGVHHPVQGSKVFLQATPDGGRTQVTYPCVAPLPDDLVDLAATLNDLDKWAQFHSGYGKWIGCAGW